MTNLLPQPPRGWANRRELSCAWEHTDFQMMLLKERQLVATLQGSIYNHSPRCADYNLTSYWNEDTGLSACGRYLGMTSYSVARIKTEARGKKEKEREQGGRTEQAEGVSCWGWDEHKREERRKGGEIREIRKEKGMGRGGRARGSTTCWPRDPGQWLTFSEW